MRQKSGPEKQPAEEAIRDIRRATRRHFSAEEKIRVVLEGLRGEESIAELCRREGIALSMYYGWSKEFLEAGKKRLAGDTARAATSDEVKDLGREAQALKEVVTDLIITLGNRLLKKSMIGDGGDEARDIPHPTRQRLSGWSSNRLGRLDASWKSSAFPDRRFTAGTIDIDAADRRSRGSPLTAGSDLEPNPGGYPLSDCRPGGGSIRTQPAGIGGALHGRGKILCLRGVGLSAF